MVDFNAIQEKWQRRWSENAIFKTSIETKKPKYYVLEMYPYPSGKLHMGHLRNYSIGDSFARYKRMNGFNVLYPMGYDSFGLPAENAAIKNKSHPKSWTEKTSSMMMDQQKMLGLSYDWDRLVTSMDPGYYRWNQWVFLQLFKKGLAYKKEAPINWCAGCGTVLANEQVEDGKCWRCKGEVEEKNLEQWFFKITDYAEELLEDIDTKLQHWPERVKIMQKNWIGKSHGTIIHFDVVDEKGNKIDKISTFTTRPDTVFGITYLVLAVEHPKVLEWTKGTKNEKSVIDFIREVKKKSVIERTAEGKEKNGIFLGVYFINPVNGERFPLWAADYALMDYGTGAVMAVPTHDQRDFEFAKKYGLPLKLVISPKDGWDLKAEKMTRAFVDEGILVNSEEFNGLGNIDAIEEISKWLEKKRWGERTVNYKLRDWLISRQRYWGTPIPIIYCDSCGTMPVPEKDLPVLLPDDVEFTGEGNPLAGSKSFVNTKCPKCGGEARRETDTMDTFVDSSWYFFRFSDPNNDEAPVSKEAAKYWMPVDQYIGGIEHAVLHLLYARFYTKACRDLGLHNIDEPFTRLLCQGMVTKDGAKMSKSIGNVVDPGPFIEKFGSDATRIFMLFAALPEKELDWSDQGVAGAFRFVNRVHRLWEMKDELAYSEGEPNNRDKNIIGKMHKTIKKVTEQIESFQLSLAVGSLMEYVNSIYRYTDGECKKDIFIECMETLCQILSPFAPHICEEIWEGLGHKDFVSLARWPKYDEGRIDLTAEYLEDFISSTIGDINAVKELTKKDKVAKITLFIADPWKYDFVRIMKEMMLNTRDVKQILGELMKSDLKAYGQEITKMAPKLAKDESKMPKQVLTQAEEIEALENAKALLTEEFKADVDIIRAQDSKEAKAKQAMPGKAAIILG